MADSTIERPFDLVCLGEPMLELNLQAPDESGRRVYVEAHGGDASNVAVAAARQGARVAFLSAVGDDLAGASFLSLWSREKINASAVPVDADHPTGLYFVSHDETGHHFSYLRKGSAAARYRLDAKARDVIARSRILFASGISLGISDQAADTVFEAVTVAQSAGTTIAFDTNYRAKLWPPARALAVIREAIRQAEIVFPGLEDLQLLLGVAEPEKAIDFCLSLGPTVVVLKMGAAGALLATPKDRVVIPPFPCRPVDATGAGDTFCGSFLAQTADGASLENAARYAACAAAMATMGFGAVPPIPTRTGVMEALTRALQGEDAGGAQPL